MGINSNATLWLAFASFEIRQALKKGYATSYAKIIFWFALEKHYSKLNQV